MECISDVFLNEIDTYYLNLFPAPVCSGGAPPPPGPAGRRRAAGRGQQSVRRRTGAGAEAEAERLAEQVGQAFRGFDGLCLRAEAALKAEEAAVHRAGAGAAAAGDVRAVLREFTAGLRRTGGAGGDAKATIS